MHVSDVPNKCLKPLGLHEINDLYMMIWWIIVSPIHINLKWRTTVLLVIDMLCNVFRCWCSHEIVVRPSGELIPLACFIPTESRQLKWCLPQQYQITVLIQGMILVLQNEDQEGLSWQEKRLKKVVFLLCRIYFS